MAVTANGGAGHALGVAVKESGPTVAPPARMPRDPSRLTLPDALRALALVSVLVVNAIGYAAAPWGTPLGLATPPDSVWAQAVQGTVAAVLQGKGYTMLAFLFGMSLWLAARGRSRADALRRGVVRQRRLLGLGVVHGVFVYFGDILTLYALVGRRLLGRLHLPWGRLRRHWWLALGAAVLAKLVWVALIVAYPEPPPALGEPTLSSAAGAWGFLQLNAGVYLANLIPSVILGGPVFYFCMVCGVAAARLRLLTHRRWRPVLRRAIGWFGLPLLALSALYGWGWATTEPLHPLRSGIEVLGELTSLPMAVVYVAALSLLADGGQARWCAALAPLGRRTLSLYLGHGLLGLVLFSGAGLALQPTTPQMAALALGLWLTALGAAHRSGPRRWPLETWMARGA